MYRKQLEMVFNNNRRLLIDDGRPLSVSLRPERGD